jgi:HPt (histidine-containing phosphotransfer) domain-containing protein
MLDMAVLEGFRELQQDGSPDLVGELIELYLTDTTARLAELRAALNAPDAAAARRNLHSLKGSSANLGVRGMAGLCSRLEDQLGDGANEDARATLAQLEVEFECVQKALAGELQTL